MNHILSQNCFEYLGREHKKSYLFVMGFLINEDCGGVTGAELHSSKDGQINILF